MAENNPSSCQTINDTINFFFNWSGQTIDNNKSKILFSSNVSTSNIANTAKFFNMNYCQNFGKYLGFPIFDKKHASSNYDFILDNLTKILGGWKIKFLTITGRTTLAKATLNNIPTHVMTYIKLSKEIMAKIDQIQRNFIWGTTCEKKKLQLLN